MALESISFLAYFLARLPADPLATDNTLLIEQVESIRRVSINDLIEALSLELGGGTPVTLLEETTLTPLHGVVFTMAPLHLPTYASVSARKQYLIKNVNLTGGPDCILDAPDGKTIDGLASITIIPGEAVSICKDGTNWQTMTK